VDLYPSVRSDFVDYFVGVESYCIGLEEHLSGRYHLHAYLWFYELTTCDVVRKSIEWFDGTINILPLKSRKSWLKYITKEDDDPYFNVPLSELSFRVRALNWARKERYFSVCHPFVVEHKHMYKYLEEFHREARIQNRSVVRELKVYDKYWGGWQNEVVDWWNDYIKLCS
jgi:hypothetical protein